MSKKRKIFFVVASGGHDTDIHYQNTIKNKRTIKEAARFLSSKETEELRNYFHGQPYTIWGAVLGKGNLRTWQSMEPGDYVMIYRKGKVILAAEIAMKAHNSALARYFWGVDKNDKTWEYIYFLINEVEVNVVQSELNKYLGYAPNYSPQGFMAIQQDKVDKLLSVYGDLLSFLQKIESGEEPEEVGSDKKEEFEGLIEKRIERASSIHDEIQWRLIRLGKRAHFDVWVPKADQNKEYQGEKFKNFVIREFHEAIDIPSYIQNIDTVWKLGFSVKSAFEIEHTTQIYSGILRLSDLRALAPNSNYPLFIITERDKKNRVFDQLKRPTFSNDYLRLDKVVSFLSYDKVRELDKTLKNEDITSDLDWLTSEAESLNRPIYR